MLNIVVKSGIKQLPLFKNSKFPLYEAYINENDDLNALFNTEMSLLSIHLPNWVKKNGQLLRFDLNPKSYSYTESTKMLRKVIYFSNTNNIRFIIAHIGHYNCLIEDKFHVIDKTISILDKIDFGDVKLCIENVPCWLNLSFENEPLISDANNLKYMLDRCPKLGSVFDVDHIAINTVFSQFYREIKQKYGSFDDLAFHQKTVEDKISTKVRKNSSLYYDAINVEIDNFFNLITPDIIHAVGSDYFNYQYSNNLPLHGEGLPMGFSGEINDYQVKDKLDHVRWVKHLNDNVYVTLELINRLDYDYLNQIKDNWQFIENIYSSKSN